MPSRSHYRIQHVATTPRGWKVRSIEQGGHVIRIAFPPGRREQGSGHVVEILHPKHENPGVCSSATRAMNPAELVLMGANPHRGKETPREKRRRLTEGWRRALAEGRVVRINDEGTLKSFPTAAQAQSSGYPIIRENPTRSQRIRGARERSEEIRRVHHEFNPHDPLWAIRWDTGNVSQAFHSKGEAERMLRNFHDAGKLIRMNPMPASGERYRNPLGGVAALEGERAREIREGFTASDSRGYRVADEPLIPSGDYAELGKGGAVRGEGETAAAYLAVKPAKGGYRLQIGIPAGVTFLSDTTRRQIWIAGAVPISGDEMKMFTNDHGPVSLLGKCVGIGYIAVKYHPQIENHAAGRRILWEHEFGEENGVLPDLLYDFGHQRLLLEGGDYTVKDEGIVN